MAFDVPTAGRATLTYTTDSQRSLWLTGQLVVWLVLVLAATRFRPSQLLRRRATTGVVLDRTPVVDLTAPMQLPNGEGEGL